MKEHIHSRIAKILVVLALAVVASVMFVFVGCNNECTHENARPEVVAVAGCTTEGITREVCDDCGHVTEIKTPALGHDWDEGTVVAATCTAGGYTLQTCSRCTAQRQVEPTEPTGHTWDEGKVVAATCTTGGYTLQTCTACGAQQQVNPTEPTGHNYAIDESKTVAGTCLTNGSVTYVCADCGDTYTEQTALGQHNYEKVTVASTCTTAGYTAERCTVCGNERKRENLPLAKHNFERDDEHSYAATCTVDGVEIEVCANCGITNTYTLKATGHKWGEAETVAPTCTKDGYSIHTCTVCNTEQRYATVEAAGHKWDNETVLTQEPTCTERGYSYVPCLNCTERQTIDILDPLGHSFVYSTKTVITPATCTTNGSMTAPCTRCGTMHTYTGNQLAAMTDTELAALNIPNAIFTDEDYNLVNVGAGNPTAEGAFTFLVSPGHDYEFDNDYPCVTMTTNAEGTALWNRCLRESCKAEWETVDHTPPAGALPCVSMFDNAAMSADEKAKYDEATQKAYAYACTVCGGLQAIQNHDFAVYNLVSGNPMFDDWDECKFELSDDQSMTALTCEDYLICKDCKHIEIAVPHTLPEVGDAQKYFNNCAHGHLCTVCEIEMTLPLGHNRNGKSDAENPDKFADGLGYVAPTCTEIGYEYEYCTGCVARTAYEPEKVEWVEGVNYWVSEVAATEHLKWTDYTTIQVSRKGDDEVLNCLDGHWDRDICDVEGCGATRISVKPTFYFYSPDQEKYLEIADEGTFNSAAATDNVYVADGEGAYTKVEANEYTSLSWTTDKYGRPWTDEFGNYGGAEPGEHTWKLLPLEEYTEAQLKQYKAVNCVDNGFMLLYCPVCGNTEDDGTVSHVQTWAAFKHNAVAGEYSIEDYAKLLGYDTDDELIAAMKAAGTWHKAPVYDCGHDYCDYCVEGNHNEQYSIDVVFTAGMGIANLEDIPYYSCREDSENQERLNAILDEIKFSMTADGFVYEFAYYTKSDNTGSTTIEEFFIGNDGTGQVYIDKTLYVAVTKTSLNEANNYFDTTFNQNSSWYNGGEGHEGMTLDVEFKFNNTIINYETITSIKVTVKSNTGALYAQAVSSGANLTNLLKNAMISWDADKDGELDKPEELWLSIGWFCESADMDTDPEGNWLFTYGEGFENNIDLDNYVVTIEITTSVDEEPWTSTQTIANNNIVEPQP